MKTSSIEGVTDDVASEISMAEGKIRLTLVPAHLTGVYSVCRDAHGSYSDWKGYPKSPQERMPL
jgi:hypothetical protein